MQDSTVLCSSFGKTIEKVKLNKSSSEALVTSNKEEVTPARHLRIVCRGEISFKGQLYKCPSISNGRLVAVEEGPDGCVYCLPVR